MFDCLHQSSMNCVFSKSGITTWLNVMAIKRKPPDTNWDKSDVTEADLIQTINIMTELSHYTAIVLKQCNVGVQPQTSAKSLAVGQIPLYKLCLQSLL